jgi:hypothetical protein
MGICFLAINKDILPFITILNANLALLSSHFLDFQAETNLGV